MKVVVTIEARMASTRLPGKVLLPVDGKPMLEHLVNRLRQVKSINEIVLATTINPLDDTLVDFAKKLDLTFHRGSEEDVMQRVIEAAELAKADIVVEITGDCPVIDPQIIEHTIQMFLHNKCDYLANNAVRSYPDGMDTQVFWLETLKRSAAMTDDPLDREHVTYHIIKNPELFSIVNSIAPPALHWPELGLTLDEPKDYELLKLIIEHFGDENPFFTCGEIINLLHKNPSWININAQVTRKGFT